MSNAENEDDWKATRLRFLACNWREQSSETLSSVDGESVGWSDFGILPTYKVSQFTTSRTSVTIVE